MSHSTTNKQLINCTLWLALITVPTLSLIGARLWIYPDLDIITLPTDTVELNTPGLGIFIDQVYIKCDHAADRFSRVYMYTENSARIDPPEVKRKTYRIYQNKKLGTDLFAPENSLLKITLLAASYIRVRMNVSETVNLAIFKGRDSCRMYKTGYTFSARCNPSKAVFQTEVVPWPFQHVFPYHAEATDSYYILMESVEGSTAVQYEVLIHSAGYSKYMADKYAETSPEGTLYFSLPFKPHLTIAIDPQNPYGNRVRIMLKTTWRYGLILALGLIPAILVALIQALCCKKPSPRQPPKVDVWATPEKMGNTGLPPYQPIQEHM